MVARTPDDLTRRSPAAPPRVPRRTRGTPEARHTVKEPEEHPPMSQIQESVDLEVPVRAAYDQWTQFEEFPKFMEGVEEIRQLDDTHLHWKTKVAGREKEFDAEVTEQTPDQRIA